MLAAEEEYPLVQGKYMVDAGPSEAGWHKLMSGLRCPQLACYHRKLRIVFPESTPLVRGGLGHLGLAHYYRRVQSLQEGTDPEMFWDPISAMRLRAAELDARPEYRIAPEGISPRACRHPKSVSAMDLVEQCCDSVKAYAKHWGGFEDDHKIIAVERQMKVMVPDNGWSLDPAVKAWLYTQRLDLVVEDKGGFKYIIDHKTAGRKDFRQERAYARSGQFQGFQLFGREAFGRQWGGTLINFIYFHNPTAKKNYQHFSFRRVTPPILPWRVQCFPTTVRHGERTWQDIEQRNLNPWHYPKVGIDNGSCEHRYGACPAADLCDYGPQALEDETPQAGGNDDLFLL